MKPNEEEELQGGQLTMKRIVCLLTVLCMLLTSFAFAEEYHYTQIFDTEATFETLEEAKVNGPARLSGLYEGRTYISDPALATYPEGTTYVYRAAGRYTSLTAAHRMHTQFVVFTEKAFASKDEALAYLKDELKLVEVVDRLHGNIVLVTPMDPSAGFGAKDQYAYTKLSAASTNLGYSERKPDGAIYYAENADYGCQCHRHLIGIDGGADFLSKYVASNLDLIGRVASMLLVNPTVATKPAVNIPVYMVNPSEAAFESYQGINEAYACEENDLEYAYFNQAYPMRKAVVAKADAVSAELLQHIYYDFQLQYMRAPITRSGDFTPYGEFSHYNGNQAPYALSYRGVILDDDKTIDGLILNPVVSDELNMYQAANGEYLDTWYEFLPEEVLDPETPAQSIPMILCLHGGGDDPVQATVELGITYLAGAERIVVVSPRYHTDVPGNSLFGNSPFDVGPQSYPALVRLMLKKYPAIDPSRVYVMGYSMGGASTIAAFEGDPTVFAAAVPMAAGSPMGIYAPTEEEAAVFEKVDLPIMLTTSQYDLAVVQNPLRINPSYEMCFQRFAKFNEMGDWTFDYDQYPIFGIKADKKVTTMLNGEYENYTWYVNNDDGVPMLALNVTMQLPHGLNPNFNYMVWNYMKQFSRDQETLEIVYNPYAD